MAKRTLSNHDPPIFFWIFLTLKKPVKRIPVTAAQACEICPPGRLAPEVGAASCEQCQPGRWQQLPGAPWRKVIRSPFSGIDAEKSSKICRGVAIFIIYFVHLFSGMSYMICIDTDSQQTRGKIVKTQPPHCWNSVRQLAATCAHRVLQIQPRVAAVLLGKLMTSDSTGSAGNFWVQPHLVGGLVAIFYFPIYWE